LLVGLIAVALAALSFVTNAQPALGSPSHSAIFGHNLIVNGGAEANVGSDDETVVVKPTGWTTTGQFGVFKYGGIFGFPDNHVPGPPNRGHNFFTGGDAALSTATQTIDLRAGASAIDAGAARYTLAAWLGGYDAQEDYGTVAATFLDAHAHALLRTVIGPVTPTDRGGKTGLVPRSKAGAVPAGARTVRILLTARRVVGTSDDGYIDNVSLVLSRVSRR